MKFQVDIDLVGLFSHPVPLFLSRSLSLSLKSTGKDNEQRANKRTKRTKLRLSMGIDKLNKLVTREFPCSVYNMEQVEFEFETHSWNQQQQRKNTVKITIHTHAMNVEMIWKLFFFYFLSYYFVVGVV